jgi:hypothetical protein
MGTSFLEEEDGCQQKAFPPANPSTLPKRSSQQPKNREED